MKFALTVLAIAFCIPTRYSITHQDNVRIDGLIKTEYVCPDCGEWGCIYEDIDTRYDEGTDTEIEQAIESVCIDRGITDTTVIDLLKANYYL